MFDAYGSDLLPINRTVFSEKILIYELAPNLGPP